MNLKPVITIADNVVVMDEDGTVWWQGRGGRTWIQDEYLGQVLEFFLEANKRRLESQRKKSNV